MSRLLKILFLGFFFNGCQKIYTQVFLIPIDFHGCINVVYGVKNGEKPVIIEDTVLFKLNKQDTILYTSFPEAPFGMKQELTMYYYYDSLNNLFRINELSGNIKTSHISEDSNVVYTESVTSSVSGSKYSGFSFCIGNKKTAIDTTPFTFKIKELSK